jgi:effector-binding domain-containing protein
MRPGLSSTNRRSSCKEPRSTDFEIHEKQVDPLLVAGIRMKGRYSDCGQAFAKLGRRLGRHISGKPLCLFYDDGYRESDADFEPCMPISKQVEADGTSVRTLPGGRCLSLMHAGPYENLGGSYDRLQQYVQQHACRVSRPSREIYHKGPGMFFRGNPKKYLTEIQFMLAD